MPELAAQALNRRVTLSRPTVAAQDGPYQDQGTYSDVATVWGAVMPLSASESERYVGTLQMGSVRLIIRRPVQSAGAEVVPDRTWKAAYTEAGETRTLHVAAVVDGTPKLPAAALWSLICQERRGIA